MKIVNLINTIKLDLAMSGVEGKVNVTNLSTMIKMLENDILKMSKNCSSAMELIENAHRMFGSEELNQAHQLIGKIKAMIGE
ncbi:MAG: hypothetical protein ACXQS8_08735 [Candidatus Helarchaeales archaeon]